jgi:chemosensory pili system protein ChpA (sensor histidine kinase/response regulator)
MGRQCRLFLLSPAELTEALNCIVGPADNPVVAEILVVDDDADIRSLIRMTLESYGFSVREASDGLHALQALEEHAPDAMVLDVMMPRMDGFGVLRAMRQRELAPHTRVLVLTCKTDERDFARGWELGADHYQTKPFEPTVLVDTLQDLIRTSTETLDRRRQAELEKAELLDRLESAFSRPTRS